MMILARWVLSLFITGDKGSHIFNPMAALMVGGALFLGYQVLTLKSQNYELMRQIEVVQEAAQDKAKTLKEANDEKDEAVEIINSGKFDNAYLKRLQQSD
jgi:uncharacterized membrane protein